MADPFGRVIAKAGQDTEEVLIARCDPRIQEETRRNWPFPRDRRVSNAGYASDHTAPLPRPKPTHNHAD